MFVAINASSPLCGSYRLRLAASRPLVATHRNVSIADRKFVRPVERSVSCTASATLAIASIVASTRVADPVDQPSDRGISPHPDALRREKEREARRLAREADIVLAKTNSWWEANGPENLMLASTNEMLAETVQQGNMAGRLVAVKFFAPWCQACKALYPKWIQLATQNPDVTFVKVNAADETMRVVAASMGVTKLPYFHMYTHGQLAKNFTANLHKVSYLKRAISDCKECLTPGCH